MKKIPHFNIKKVLIANRGEIALRIIRTLKEIGVKSVAVYSEADKYSLHVKEADEALCIGPAPASESYLNTGALLEAAKISGSQALHPGYGFLSENAAFAKAVTNAGLIFIGPDEKSISKLGDKAQARAMAKSSGVPIIEGVNQTGANPLETAKKVGFPLMIKAVLGGGGCGMRAVTEEKYFKQAFETAGAEAKAAFGDGRLYFEKLIQNPRHIEVQIAADNYGNIIASCERDCSMQRNHQKIIEESPSPSITKTLREKLQQAAKKIALAANYRGVGTVEFLLDEQNNFYFMEVNARLQVEHPITEAIHNIDLVKMQIEIACGIPLKVKQKDFANPLGHALELRINAEDYRRNFIPCSGTINEWRPAAGLGVRLDSHIYEGYTIPPYYDSLIAKLIITAPDRPQALARAKRALDEFDIKGVKTTLDFHKKVLQNKDFIEGKTNIDLTGKIIKDESCQK